MALRIGVCFLKAGVGKFTFIEQGDRFKIVTESPQKKLFLFSRGH